MSRLSNALRRLLHSGKSEAKIERELKQIRETLKKVSQRISRKSSPAPAPPIASQSTSPSFPLELLSRCLADLERLKTAVGRIEARQIAPDGNFAPLHTEFGAFSQFGEDGILQRIIASIPSCPKSFIEFGVEDYSEANTRFLLLSGGWRGLVLDGSPENVYKIQNSETYWRCPLQARCAFITRENINQLFEECGFRGELGILSVDLDGNDYWVWESISAVDPVIVIVEYNALFGPTEPVTIPYRPDFSMTKAHWSWQFWGASVAALEHLARKKGYRLVAGNAAGNNLFFVKSDVANGPWPALPPEAAWNPPQFKMARSRDGSLSYTSPKESLRQMAEMEVWNVITSANNRLGELKISW